MLASVNAQNFENDVLKSQQPYLLEFWASWCAPCTMMAATMEAVAEKYQGKIIVGRINSDEHPELCETYEVRGLPTALLFRGGKVIERFVGLVPKANIEGVISMHV